VRLGTEFLVLRRTRQPGLDPTSISERAMDEMQERIVVPYGKEIWLHPGHFILAATLEYLRIPADFGAYVLGRSSWGRVGLIVATAIMVQPGFKGCLTLELVNDGDSPIKLYPGARVAQLAVHSLNVPTDHFYGPDGKYKAPIAPQASRLAKEAKEAAQFEELSRDLRSRMLGEES
jgi:dCTP deaminase